ncbi:MAG: outer membrane beta-barrel protein [Candidatus Zixiibacteriota bacterium]
MNSGSCIWALVLLTAVALFGLTPAQAENLGGRSMAGGRAGVWVNNGDVGPLSVSDGFDIVTQDVSDAGLYAEVYYSYGLSRWLRLEASAGITNRTNRVSSGDVVFGSVNMYPLVLAGRFYPLGSVSLGDIHPYAMAGVGLTIASQSRQAINSFFGDSRTDATVNFVFGGGADIPVASKIGLNVSGKYQKIDFGAQSFNNLRDFSGFSIAVGVFYMTQ